MQLTLVSAPAGYGKSTVLAAWLDSSELPSCWLSLDEQDNDLGVFLSYLVAAIHEVVPGFGTAIQLSLQAAEIAGPRALVATFINDLAEVEQSFVAVVDDYHHVHDQKVHDFLNDLLRHAPRSMHLVLATRRDPPLALTKLRVSGSLNELRAADLRFTRDEAASLLHDTLGVPVDDPAIGLLEHRTEGWVAGLQLAALSLAAHTEDRERFLSSLSGDNRYVMDYLVEEVVNHQPRAIREYMLATSVLDRFCGPICEAIRESDGAPGERDVDGEQFIQSVERANLFVIPLDDEHKWFRYHHLFRRLLQKQLEAHASEKEIAKLHSRASSWLFAKGHVEEALHHASKAGEKEVAGDLVAQSRNDLMNREEWHRLRLLLDVLPREVIDSNAELLMAEAWLFIGWAEMADVMAKVEALLMEAPRGSAAVASLNAELDTLRSLVFYHLTDGEQSLDHARKALDNLPESHTSERGLAVILQCMAHQMLGDSESARKVARRAASDRAHRGTTLQARSLLALCFADYIAADLTSVLQIAPQCVELGESIRLAETIAHGYYFQGISHFDRDDLTHAECNLWPVVKGPYVVNSHNFAFSALALALTYQALGRPEDARDAVDGVVAHAVETGNASLLHTGHAFQAELALRQGRLSEVAPWVEAYNPEPFTAAYRFYIPQMTLAKWFLAQDDEKSRQRAADLLAKLFDFVSRTHHTKLLIEVLALQALVHDSVGEEEQALAKLKDSVGAAARGGVIRPLVELGPRLMKLLSRLDLRGDQLQHSGRIQTAFNNERIGIVGAAVDSEGPPTRPSGSQPLIDPLSSRELDVLELLAQRLTNKEIAAKLHLSPTTVKRHTVNIYQKLNVHKRRDAVAKAASLGMLQSR
jgi:LuxR family maltose regulon positive regulatory protein